MQLSRPCLIMPSVIRFDGSSWIFDPIILSSFLTLRSSLYEQSFVTFHPPTPILIAFSSSTNNLGKLDMDFEYFLFIPLKIFD